MNTNQKLSLLIFLNRKKSSADGKAPVYCRITIAGLKEELSLGYKIVPDHWNVKHKRVSPQHKNAAAINLKIKQTKTSLEHEFLKLQALHDRVTPAMLKAKITPEKVKSQQATDANLPSPVQQNMDISTKVDNLIRECLELDKEERKIKKLIHPAVIEERNFLLAEQKKKLLERAEKAHLEINTILDNKERTKSLLNALDEQLILFVKNVLKANRAATTLRKWIFTKKKICSFVWFRYQKADLWLPDIQLSLATHFYDYLTTHDDCGHNNAVKHIKNTKQALELSVTNGWIIKNPIEKFRCTYIDPEIEPASEWEIITLINAELSGAEDIVRDGFLMECFTGYAYEELNSLRRSDIVIGIDGEKWLRTGRKKTNGTIETVPLLPIALQILDKYKDHPACLYRDKLLPVYSNQYYNKHIKAVGRKLSLNIELHPHRARHIFATTIALDNGMPLPVVGKILGHKSIRTTERYAKVSRLNISRNMRRIKRLLFDEEGKFVGTVWKDDLQEAFRGGL
ncbi:site-specific integrase [Compostibacter hankyongensis]